MDHLKTMHAFVIFPIHGPNSNGHSQEIEAACVVNDVNAHCYPLSLTMALEWRTWFMWKGLNGDYDDVRRYWPRVIPFDVTDKLWQSFINSQWIIFNVLYIHHHDRLLPGRMWHDFYATLPNQSKASLTVAGCRKPNFVRDIMNCANSGVM